MPTERERLLAKFESGALVRPAPDVPNLVDLAAAWWTCAGVTELPLTSAASRFVTQIGTPEHLVCVVADGLGLDLLEAMPAASFLWQRLAGALRTVFPSTTAVALTSFYTARWPATHGVVGHWMQLPPPAGAVTVLSSTTRYDGRALGDLNVREDDLFGAASLFAQATREALFVAPGALVNSAYSMFAAGGVERRGYRSLREGFEAVRGFIGRSSGPTCSVLYTPRIDDMAHEHGPAHMEVVGAVRALDAEVALLSRALGDRARIVLTADHGHLPVPPGGRLRMMADSEAGRMLAASPGGDARMLTFHLRSDAVSADFAWEFLHRYGEQFALLTPDDVEALGLLGPEPIGEAARRRLGDCVAVALGPDVLEWRTPRGRPDRRLELPSHHSGLTAAEMRVPFILI